MLYHTIPSKIHHIPKSNFIFCGKIYLVEQEIPSRFCLQFCMKNLIWSILFNVAVNKAKTIYHLNSKLAEVSYFSKVRLCLLVLV